jgi:hypothetical protein
MLQTVLTAIMPKNGHEGVRPENGVAPPDSNHNLNVSEDVDDSSNWDNYIALSVKLHKYDLNEVTHKIIPEYQSLCNDIGELQLEILIKVLEHPKMFHSPGLNQHLMVILDLVFYKYMFTEQELELELCLRLFDALLPYFTRQNAEPSYFSIYRPVVSIVELMHKYDFDNFLGKFGPYLTRRVHELALKLFSQFDYRDSVAQITELTPTQKFDWARWAHIKYSKIFTTEQYVTVDFDNGDIRITPTSFFDDAEIRTLYARFQAQVVQPDQLEATIKQHLETLVLGCFVETPEENRLLFETELIAHMVRRAVIHCEQICIYQIDQFYQRLAEWIHDVIQHVSVDASRVSTKNKKKIMAMFEMLGCGRQHLIFMLLSQPSCEADAQENGHSGKWVVEKSEVVWKDE